MPWLVNVAIEMGVVGVVCHSGSVVNVVGVVVWVIITQSVSDAVILVRFVGVVGPTDHVLIVVSVVESGDVMVVASFVNVVGVARLLSLLHLVISP